VEQSERIRREHREEGVSIRDLARRHKVHRRVVRQALASAVPPPRKPVESCAQPAIGPHATTVRGWLTEDQAAPRKQRHTARRVWERLGDEHGADVAESTVRRYVRGCRRELHLDHVDVAIVAHHDPGDEAQVDLGLSEGQEAFLEGHMTAFARLGGVPVIGAERIMALTGAPERTVRTWLRDGRLPQEPMRGRLLTLAAGGPDAP
jgi:transposase